MEWGVKLSKPNKDVLTADEKDLIFNTSDPSLKVIQSGKYNLSIASSTTTTYTIPLSSSVSRPLLPLVNLYVPSLNSYKGLSGISVIYDLVTYLRGKFEYDDNNLYVTIENYTGANVDTHFYYFLCYA